VPGKGLVWDGDSTQQGDMVMMQQPLTKEKKAAPSQILYDIFPQLEDRCGWVSLGNYPTPVEPLVLHGALKNRAPMLWVKREDISSEIYGGNKIRTLEWLFAEAIGNGADEICSTGSYGSNHAVATILHAPHLGLRSSVMLYPQPYSQTARDNLDVTLSTSDEINAPANWTFLPLAVLWKKRRDKAKNRTTFIMAPGGATPTGALGYVSAALELARQVISEQMPMPRRIVLAVGSTCTTAGLLLGTAIAGRLGFTGRWSRPPDIVAVRVTPWPVTAPRRIALLSFRTSRLLYRLTGDPRVLVSYSALLKRLFVDGSRIGKGYGHLTPSGLKAMEHFPDIVLDTTYSAKAAAALVDIADNRSGCTLFWATKSSAPLPVLDQGRINRAPSAMLRWLKKGEPLGN
jgi:D-cysteine desulfhydrase